MGFYLFNQIRMESSNNNILSIGLILLFWLWEDSAVKLIVGGLTAIWLTRQIYISFRKERRAAEKHGKEQTLLDLQIRTAKRSLGEDGEDQPKSEE